MIEEDRLIARGDREPAGRVCRDGARGLARPGAEASELIEATVQEATARGVGRPLNFAAYASSVLYNGLGRHDAARDAAWRAFERDQAGLGPFVVPELAEAASRTGDVALVRAALEWLSERTRVTPTDWALGIEARVRALLSDGDAAESSTASRSSGWAAPASARSSPARTCSTASGCAASAAASTRASSCAPPTTCWTRWASRRSPSGPGASCWPPARRPASAPSRHSGQLTAQEAQIARLARDGLSNPEIGARLFISSRTVQYHLGKVFAKLGISSRSQLDQVLPAEPDTAQPR